MRGRNNTLAGESHPKWKGGRYLSWGYAMVPCPDHPRACAKGYVLEHILVAEKAVGHMLPVGVEIHHVNGCKDDNSPGNLVVCEGRLYHLLLHARTRAFDATGNPNLRRCCRCHTWDSIDNLILKHNDSPRHKRCGAKGLGA